MKLQTDNVEVSCTRGYITITYLHKSAGWLASILVNQQHFNLYKL
jgi:hypothetical protein